MCAIDVLASIPRQPRHEGVGMKQLRAGETLPNELPERRLQETSPHHCTAGAVSEPRQRSTFPIFTLCLWGHISFSLSILAFTCLWRAPRVLLAWCCALASASLHFVALLVNPPAKKLNCLWQPCMGQTFVARKLLSKVSQPVTFGIGHGFARSLVWTRKIYAHTWAVSIACWFGLKQAGVHPLSAWAAEFLWNTLTPLGF